MSTTQKHSLWLVIGLSAATLVSATGCSKSAETERREAERAAAEAERKTAEAQQEAMNAAREEGAKVANETSEFLAAVNREKGELTDKVQDELDKIDRRLGELKVETSTTTTTGATTKGTVADQPAKVVKAEDVAKDKAEMDRLTQRRSMLQADLASIRTAIPQDWSALKAKIERDLGDKAPILRTPNGT